jgi:hypothetical protein
MMKNDPWISRLRRKVILTLSILTAIYAIVNNCWSIHQARREKVSLLTKQSHSLTTRKKTLLSRNLQVSIADDVKPYSQDDIMKTIPYFQQFPARLLVFDGEKFQVFGVDHIGNEYFATMKITYRYIDSIPMLVHALVTNFPDRFKPGMPPFELLFSDADSPHTKCSTMKCPADKFAPVIVFGSTPKDDSVYPTFRSFPNPIFMHCLYQYKIYGHEACDWPQKVKKDIPWENLIDTIVWRGMDWPFLYYHDKKFRFEGATDIQARLASPEWKSGGTAVILKELSEKMSKNLTPRWRGAILSALAAGDSTPWIDTKFTGGMNTGIHASLGKLGIVISGDRIEPEDMSYYKYQIDYGGGGGTTWEGTLTKLMMPGVLMHHECKS